MNPAETKRAIQAALAAFATQPLAAAAILVAKQRDLAPAMPPLRGLGKRSGAWWSL